MSDSCWSQKTNRAWKNVVQFAFWCHPQPSRKACIEQGSPLKGGVPIPTWGLAEFKRLWCEKNKTMLCASSHSILWEEMLPQLIPNVRNGRGVQVRFTGKARLQQPQDAFCFLLLREEMQGHRWAEQFRVGMVLMTGVARFRASGEIRWDWRLSITPHDVAWTMAFYSKERRVRSVAGCGWS